MSRIYEATNENHMFKVYTIVRKAIDANPTEDYFAINDRVHNAVKEEFGYTHALRKEYQTQIKFVFRKRNKSYPV